MKKVSTARIALALLLSSVLLGGCATLPPGASRDPRDPWERVNRPIFNFDLALAQHVAVPVAHGYERVVPRVVRTGIGNFMDNSFYPSVFVNDFLQGKFRTFLSDTARFLFNSTVGIGGLLDPASKVGLPKNDNDFGRTLGTWGVPAGPYLVLPVLGTSDVRDGLARIPEGYLWPVNYIPNGWAHYGIWIVYLFDEDDRVVVPAYELLKSQQVFDEYAFARNFYLQRREYQIHGQSAQSEEQHEQELQKGLEEGTDDSSGGANAPPPAGSGKPH
jgi:phospholipid-binding lipoprotein MlaA